MFRLISFVPVLIIMCVETIGVPLRDGLQRSKERDPLAPRVLPPELHVDVDKDANLEEKPNSRFLPFHIPTQKTCGEMGRPSYAKATCTSYPGRVVCQLGRYTFVINNGEHKMNPEIIERFAALVYHRSQDGDSDFDVSVDIPVKNNDEYLAAPPTEETTTVHKEEAKYPVFVECTPIPDDRKMCNPTYIPSEITYSCKRRELGYGGFSDRRDRSMLISVDSDGTVSAGDLVLPYNALIDKRMKRQKEKAANKAALMNVTPSGADNKLYSDVCSFQTKGWCPNFVVTECPSDCRTVNTTAGQECAHLDAASPNGDIDQPAADDVPQALSGENIPSRAIQPQVEPQGPSAANLTPEEEDLSLLKNDEAELYAVSNLPPPQVRVYSDICLRSTEIPWCPPSVGEIVDSSVPTCVTIDECAPSTKQPRKIREEPKETKPLPFSKHLQNRMRNGRKLGPKRIYRKRKRQILQNMEYEKKK